MKDAELLNVDDDNTTATFSNSVDDLITELQKESEKAKDWFRSNKMVINPNIFQSIILNRLGKLKYYYKLVVDNHEIDSEIYVTLLGIDIGNKLNFEKPYSIMSGG